MQTKEQTDVTLKPEELVQLTGFRQPCRQLSVLHKRGFTRAYIGRSGLVLERAHYDAVCRGQLDKAPAKQANLGFFGARK